MESLFERILSVQDVEKELLWLVEENGGHAENAETDTTRKILIAQTLVVVCDMSQKNQVAIINVGANTRHYKGFGKIKSPIFYDGTFEFIPVPTGKLVKGEEHIEKIKDWPRYKELKSFYGKESLAKFLPSRRWLDLRMHNDPQFDIPTYGDYLGNPRASKLRNLKKGDYLFFLAHLWRWISDGIYDERGDFFLIGFFEISDWIELDNPNEKELTHYRKNPHVLAWYKLRSDSKASQKMDFRNHRIFKGTRNSKRFQKAVPFNREIADKVLRDVQGRKLKWHGRTALSTIGSYTRTVKFVKGPNDDESDALKRIQILWEYVKRYA